uniref:Uncharacterized protein n=1 Tax=Anguilla anguilla TaxID=7936 RepID=A0A0E9W561_ANGAN
MMNKSPTFTSCLLCYIAVLLPSGALFEYS